MCWKLYSNICNIGSKRLYCIHSGGSWRGFSVISLPNLNRSGWNPDYKWGVTVHTHTKNTGKIAAGVSPKGAKTCFVFVINTTRTFSHLSCTDFDCFWNKRRESVSACIHRWKISEFMCREFHRFQKQLKISTFAGGVLIRLQLKWHNIG